MVRVIILAAGKGKRMGGADKPKVLQPLMDRPLLSYVLEAVADSGVDGKPVVIVGHLADQVREVCGSACEYAVQTELRGTGDAVRAARPLLEEAAARHTPGGGRMPPEHVLVLNGDHPLVTGRTIRRVVDMHLAGGSTMTMATVVLENFEDWRTTFSDFGRIVRNGRGAVERIVEMKDAGEAEKALKEVNPNVFCFKTGWLWPNLETLTTDNVQGEYYLTALAAKAIAQGVEIMTVPMPPEEAVGVNTPEQLEQAERLLKRKLAR